MTNVEKRAQVLREQCNTLKLTIESIEGTAEHGRIKDLEAIVSILNAMLEGAARSFGLPAIDDDVEEEYDDWLTTGEHKPAASRVVQPRPKKGPWQRS
jgi:hypothetical protein